MAPRNDDGLIDGLLAAVFALMALVFGAAFDAMYWRWRDCYNELGRCYNPDGAHVVYTTAGAVWLLPCVVCIVVSLAFALRRQRARRAAAAEYRRYSTRREPQ